MSNVSDDDQNTNKTRNRQYPLSVLLLALILVFSLATGIPAQTPDEALFQAVEINDMDAVEAAITAGADLASKNSNGMTPADVAVDLGHFRIAHVLLAKRTANASSAPRVTEKGKKALITPRARVAIKRTRQTTPAPVRPDPKLSDLVPPKKPIPAIPSAIEPPSLVPPSVDDPIVPGIAAPMEPASPSPTLPEPRVDDEFAKSSPEEMAPKPEQMAASEEPGFFGSIWGGVKNVVTLGGLIGQTDTEKKDADRRLTSKGGEIRSSPADRFGTNPADRFASPPPKESDSSAGRMVDRMKGIVGSDNVAENEFGLPISPVVPPLITPPGMVTIETAERSSGNELPGLVDPLLEVPGLVPPTLGDETTIEIPGLVAPGESDITTIPGLEDLEMPGLAAPELMDGPAPPDLEIPGLPPGLDIPGLAAPTGEVPGIIAPPAAAGEDFPALPPGLAPLAGSVTGQLRRPGGLVQPEDSNVLPPPVNGDLQDRIRRIDRILNRAPIQNSDRYTTPRSINGKPARGSAADAPLRAPAKAPVRKQPVDPLMQIPKGLDRSRTTRPSIPTEPEAQFRDPAEILRRARESEAVQYERDRKNRSIPKKKVFKPRPLRPSGHQLPTPEQVITKREEPASRLFERLAELGRTKQQDEDIHGLPIVRSAIDGETVQRKNVTVTELPEKFKADTQKKISALAKFFSGNQEEEVGMKAPSFPVAKEPLPRVIDNLLPENDPARGRVVDDKMLDLTGVELRTTEEERLTGVTRTRETQLNPNFTDRLSSVLGPAKRQPKANGIPVPEPGTVGLSDLNVPSDQIVQPTRPVLPDPWTMTIEKNNSDGEKQTLGVSAISPNDGTEIQTEQGVVAKMVGRIRNLMTGPAGLESGPAVDKLDEAERQDAAERLLSDALRDGAPSALPDQGQWPVTEVEAMNATPGVPPAPRPGVLTRTSLDNVVLSLGESVTLENTLPPQQDGIDPLNSCIKKNRGTTLFCVEPIDWPQELRNAFVVPTILYTGPMAITRYDQGSPSRFHALFESEQFEYIVAYYQARFGEPTEIWKRSIAPLAKPRMDNPTVTWRSRDSRSNVISVLEIRKFDDSRGGFPDTNRGAVMLYHFNAPSIFPQVSSHELMRLRRANR